MAQWERQSFWATCESACPVAQVRLNIYSKKFNLRINAVMWLSGISVQTRLQTPHHPFTGPILLGPPCRSTKWIYWPALSALVRCSNETALSAHHLSACQPASWSTVPNVSMCVGVRYGVWGLTVSRSQILSRAGCVILLCGCHSGSIRGMKQSWFHFFVCGCHVNWDKRNKFECSV